jgi:glycosyltransferase involved in cell wall biosynthesis
MLLTDGYGGVGGIAKFNRDFLEALDACRCIQRIRALPRLIVDRAECVVPEAVVYDRNAARGKLSFMRRLFGLALRGGPTDLVICGHLYLLPAAWLLAKFRRARLVLIIHGIEAWKRSSKPLSNWLTRKIDGFISVSQYSAERFVSWSGVSMNRAFVLPNCVDLDQFKPLDRDRDLQSRYGIQNNKVIMTTGRLATHEQYKGFDQVIDVLPRLLERYPTLKYLIVGDGGDRRRLESKVQAMGLCDFVVFAGYIDEKEKAAHYNLADAYVMPSTGEGFGIVLIEAAACGVPVVGSQADGSREALLHGQLGKLVDPQKPEELIAAIAEVLSVKRPRRRIDAIRTFDRDSFTSRVGDWCEAAADAVSDRNPSRPCAAKTGRRAGFGQETS